MKVFITSYALTLGILERDADQVTSDMISVPGSDYGSQYFHGEGRQWHKTREAAVERAEHLRLKKIKSLENQIKKLKALKFT